MGKLRIIVCVIALAAACAPGPGAPAPANTQPDRATHDKFFPIASGPHAVDCTACHTAASDSFKKFDCTTCHAQPATDAGHPALPNYQYASPGCYSCHPRGTANFDHTFFPIAAADTHALRKQVSLGAVTATIACATCHTEKVISQVDCTACHTQANLTTAQGKAFHASVPDLPANFAPGTATSAQCLLCHSDSKVPVSVTYSSKAAVHDVAFGFRITPGTAHAGLSCLDCHVARRELPGVPAVAADFKVQSCVACHAPAGSLKQDCDALHTGLGSVNGFTYLNLSNPPSIADTANCLNCHRDGGVGSFNHAQWFPIGAADTHALGKSLNTSSGAVTVSCASCHLDPANRQNVTCTACHSAAGANAAGPAAIDLTPAHSTRLAGLNWEAPARPTAQCMLCHATDLLERVDAHGKGSSAFPSDAPGKGFPISSGNHFVSCESCHTAQVSNDLNLKDPRTDFNQRSCDACHTEARDSLVSNHRSIGVTIADPAGLPNNAAACLKCHPDGGPAPSTVAYSHPFFPVDSTGKHPMGQTVSRSSGGSVSFACASCHIAPKDLSQVDCTLCHAAAQMPGFHASVADLPANFAPGVATSQTQCLQCHVDGKVTVSLTHSVAKAATHDVQFGFKTTPGSIHGTTNATPAEECSTCHSVQKSIPQVTGPAGAPLTTIDFKQQNCAACHSPGGLLAQNLDQAHSGLGNIGGFRYLNLSTPPVPADSVNCLNCHRDGSVGNFDHGAWFPIAAADTHALGLRVTPSGAATAVTLACATCHQDAVTRQNVTCSTCHTAAGLNAAKPNPIDLTPAHATQLAGTNWKAPAPPTVQCMLCHAGDSLERVATHGSGTAAWPSDASGTPFIIDSSNPNHFLSCERCHTAQVASDPNLKDPRLDFSVRTCNACHSEAKEKLVSTHGLIGVTISDTVDSKGAPVPGHAKQCLSCHPNGEAAPSSVPFSHSFFPIAASSTHALGAPAIHAPGNFQCATCHTALATAPAQIDCTGCHTQAQMSSGGTSWHAAVPDLVFPQTPAPQATSLQCLQCHADSKVPASVTHSVVSNSGKHDATNARIVFKVTAGAPHDTQALAAQMKCLTCHSVSLPDPTVPGMSVAQFKVQACAACHSPAGTLSQNVDQLHAGFGTVNGFTYVNLSVPPTAADSANCLHCHQDGSRGTLDHGKWFPIAAADTHALGKSLNTSSGAVAVACATCHQDAANRKNVTCTACHSAVGLNAAAPAAIDLTPAHATKLAGANWKAPSAPTVQCMLCHATDFLERVSAHGAGSPAYASDAPGKVFAISSGNHFVSCESCHTAQVTNDPNLKDARTDFNQRSCDACHSQARDSLVTNHRGIGVTITDPAGIPNNAAACLKCHPDGGPAPSTVAYSHPFFPVDSSGKHPMGQTVARPSGGSVTFACASCHLAPQDPSQVDCTACHAAAQMPGFHASVADLPANFPPGVTTSLQCLQCHVDGKVTVSLTYSVAKVATHDVQYGFKTTPGNIHGTTNTNPAEKCSTCHAVQKNIPQVTNAAGAPITTIDFKQQLCAACHSPGGLLTQNLDQLHNGLGTVGGFTYTNLSTPPVPADSVNCLNCHKDGSVGNFDHSAWFPIGSGNTHALGLQVTLSGASTPVTLACATCHQDATTRQNVTCTTCHTSTGINATGPAPIDLTPAHLTQLAGTNWKAPAAPTVQCMLCHANDFFERTATHGSGSSTYASDAPGKAFIIDSTNSNHFLACEKCHTSQAAAGSVLKDPRTDFNQRSCNDCHTEAKEKLVSTHGLIGVTISDTVDSKGAPVPGHAKQCLSCHPNGEAAPATVPYTHPYFPIDAASTHALGAPAVHAAGVFQCATCHTALSSAPAQIDCTACHTQAQMSTAGTAWHVSVPDLIWPQTPTPQATSLQCLQCHADSKVPAQVSYSTASTFGRHDATNANIQFTITAGASHDTQRLGAQMKCLTCHTVSNAPYPAIAGFAVTDFSQRTCTTCHLATGTLAQDLDSLHTGVTTPAPGFTPVPSPVTPAYSLTCKLCHANGQIDPTLAAQNHGNFFPISATDSHAFGKVVKVSAASVPISCAACHVDSSNRRNVDCTACHLQSVNNGTPGPTVPADQATAHSGKVSTVGVSGTTDNLWSGTGPVGSGTGASARCVECHAADARPGGFVATHGKASSATGNQVFNIASTNPNHYLSCDQCHTATLIDPNRKNPAFDFNQASCDACHLPGGPASIVTAHQGFGTPITAPYIAGDPNNAAACLSCHPGGGQNTNFNHLWFPIAAADVHNSNVTRCADCHATQATYSGTPSGNIAAITCTGCHNDAAANLKFQNGFTISAIHSSAKLGRTIWDIPGGVNYADNSLCLKCHAGNIGGNVAAFSTPLVFRLAQHDTHCNTDNSLLGGGSHSVDRNADNGVPICFACHNAVVSSTGNTPWANDWTVASPTTSCIACHEHQGSPAPNRTCR